MPFRQRARRPPNSTARSNPAHTHTKQTEPAKQPITCFSSETAREPLPTSHAKASQAKRQRLPKQRLNSHSKNLKYDKCNTPFGTTVVVDFNECDYSLSAAGTFQIKCPAGKKIEFTFASGCIGTVGPQGPLNGITYANVGGQITTSVNIANIAASLDGTTLECGIDPSKTPITLEYTTGNTFLPGEKDPGGGEEGEAETWWI